VAVTLTGEQLEALQKKNLANIAAKLKAGGRLTAREDRILQAAAAGLDPEDDKNFYTLGDLSKALGLSRRGLNKARKRYPDFPEPRDDGSYEYAECLAWKVRHEVKPEPDDDAEENDTEFSKSYWDRRRARLDFERGFYAFEVEKQKHLPITEITSAVGQMLAGFRTALNNLPPSAARWIVGLRDFHAIRHKLQDEVDAVLQALGRCDYMEGCASAVVSTLFPERDATSQADIARCAEAVVREIGRRAISDLTQQTLPAE
jgi:hypothetical protein